MSLNLHLLRLFATVVRTGSFSRAADTLRISQPAISKGVRDFELQVGCRLLDRTPKGLRPTREGEALARRAEALFAVERDAEDELLSLRNLDSGSLRVGASTTIATYMIAKYLGILHRNYPAIDLRLVSGNTRGVADTLQAHDIDTALEEGPVEGDGLVSNAWRIDVMNLIVCPSHWLASSERPVDCGALMGRTPDRSGTRLWIAGDRRSSAFEQWRGTAEDPGDRKYGSNQTSRRRRHRPLDRFDGDDRRSGQARPAQGDPDEEYAHRAYAMAVESLRTDRNPGGARLRADYSAELSDPMGWDLG